MYYYLLTATTKKELRRLVQPYLRLKLSSLYQYLNTYYLLIKSPTSILAFNNYNYVKTKNLALNYLYSWAKSQIDNDYAWVNFELDAQTTPLGAYNHNFKINRLFIPLTETMLIINQTPDSFSSFGSDYCNLEVIVKKIESALNLGVDIIDVGAMSTRPNATVISSKEEITRLQNLIPLINQLKSKYSFKLSLDSFYPETILKFLPYIDIINDVSANLEDKLLLAIKEQNKEYLFMHNLTIPANPKVLLDITENPLNTIVNFANHKIERLIKLGFNVQNLIFDPGIGFNKHLEQNWFLLKNSPKMLNLGCEILIGHSRKRFLDKITTQGFKQRDLESAAISISLANKNIDYLRVHDYIIYYQLLKVNDLLT